jgi:heme-degrading monooxygenase HmoA
VDDRINIFDEALWSKVPEDVIAEAKRAAKTQPCWIARQGNGHIVAMEGPGDPEVATGDIMFIAEIGPERNIMFISIRKYNVRRGSAEKLAQSVRDGFVPLMRGMRGFRGYYLLDGGPDVLITISMFDSADEAIASNETAAEWVRNNVLEFTKGMPEVMIGNALIAEVQ